MNMNENTNVNGNENENENANAEEQGDEDEVPEAQTQLDAWPMDALDASKWLKMLDRIEKRYEAGEKALTAGKWQIAIAAFEEVVEDDPGFRDVRQKLARAREEHELAESVDEANAHGEAGRWAEACRIWMDVLHRTSDYGDSSAISHLMAALSGLLDQHEALAERLEQLESDRSNDVLG